MRNLFLVFVLGVSSIGCARSAAEAPAAAPASAEPQRKAVARIVLVDKENPCECTQKAIDATVTALGAVLAGKTVPTERIHLDTQRSEVEAYLKLRAMVAVPALYLFDAEGGLVDVVQGESDEARLRTYFN